MKKKGFILLMALLLAGNGIKEPAAGAVCQKVDTAVSSETRALTTPSGISKDSSGRMYLADRFYHVLRIRDKNGTYSVLAGQEGKSGYQDGSATKALFHEPWDVVSYKKGWAVSDTENHVIRYFNGKTVKTIAGTGTKGYKNATGVKAKFNRPTGMAVGKDGEVYVSDTGNHVIRRIDQNGKVTVYAGNKSGCAEGTLKKARFYEPTGLYYYKGALYVADSGNHRICKIADGKVTTVAGSKKGLEGNAVGSAKKARFSNPQDIILYKNDVYISDTGNGSVKKLSKGKVTTVVEAFSLGENLAPAEPCGIMIKNGYLFVGDLFAEELLKIKL
ncbi:MAG: hypothetical protein PUB10_00315 [Clostridiales bacterium]|nr:hypothetical protein [Clostridiales bacterium]